MEWNPAGETQIQILLLMTPTQKFRPVTHVSGYVSVWWLETWRYECVASAWDVRCVSWSKSPPYHSAQKKNQSATNSHPKSQTSRSLLAIKVTHNKILNTSKMFHVFDPHTSVIVNPKHQVFIPWWDKKGKCSLNFNHLLMNWAIITMSHEGNLECVSWLGSKKIEILNQKPVLMNKNMNSMIGSRILD